MRLRTLVHYAAAETRRSRGTLLFCVVSIAIGVMSLTGVRAVIIGLNDGIAAQARSIAGADLQLESNDPFGEVAAAMAADLEARGARSVELTAFYSMIYRPDGADDASAPSEISGDAERGTRLARVRAVTDGYPLYGHIDTEPADRFGALRATPSIIVDGVVLRDLGLRVGDTVGLGELRLEIIGQIVKTPGTPVAGFSLAPAVYVHQRYLDATGLLQTGSRVRYFRLFATPPELDVQAWKSSNWDAALDAALDIETAAESSASVQRFLLRLSYFLTIVGLITLLLGALGIGSAMNVFIRGKLDTAAVFRCLGARPRDVFAIYCAVALLVGGVGSAVGVGLGSALPLALAGAAERLGGELLPTQVRLGFSWVAAVHGMLAGITATFVFALLPVYRIRSVSPLRVMRRRVESMGAPRRARDLALYAAVAALLFSFILGLAVVETNSTQVAVYFTGAVALSIGALSLVARLVMAGARRVIPHLRSYHLKQGVANLYRPGNQTTAVITAVGVGVLLVATIFIVEASLQQTIDIEQRGELPNLFVIDVQPEQRERAEAIAREAGAEDLVTAPMVAARIAGVNGMPVDTSTVEKNATRRSWQDRMRTREYFLSYRDYTVDNERLTAGTFWSGTPATQEASIDQGLADNLGVKLGDRLTLDIQGIPLDTTVTSFRQIRWQAMTPNAMILLSPGEIEQAPKMFVASFRLPGQEARYRVQEQLVRAFPNLSVIDITDTAASVQRLLEHISTIMAVLALLTVLSGAIILGGAIAAGRFARQRESMLLKVLGASRRDLRKILVSEYAALAVFGGLAGWLLAEAINRPALSRFFDAPPVVPYGAIAALLVAIVALNVTVGLVISRGIANGKPLEILREE